MNEVMLSRKQALCQKKPILIGVHEGFIKIEGRDFTRSMFKNANEMELNFQQIEVDKIRKKKKK